MSSNLYCLNPSYQGIPWQYDHLCHSCSKPSDWQAGDSHQQYAQSYHSCSTCGRTSFPGWFYLLRLLQLLEQYSLLHGAQSISCVSVWKKFDIEEPFVIIQFSIMILKNTYPTTIVANLFSLSTHLSIWFCIDVLRSKVLKKGMKRFENQFRIDKDPKGVKMHKTDGIIMCIHNRFSF